VRDDRPFAGPDAPAAVFLYSPDRGGAHPEQHLAGYAGLMQADAYAGWQAPRGQSQGRPDHRGRVLGARQTQVLFFNLTRLTKAPIAAEAVKRIYDVLFAIERKINGLATQERLRVRHEWRRPLIGEQEVSCASSARQAIQEQRHEKGDRVQTHP
jgi:transposase